MIYVKSGNTYFPGRYTLMPTYHHRLCDRTGRTLHDERLELSSLQEAMAHANMGLRNRIRRSPECDFDPNGRIEIVDCDGHAVARIYCAEVIAASS
ncbi:MAG: hypothetical protein JWL91_1169 [Sphingomonas bacterium]|jgi:hypothetical protein|nr:hypothetical protein [Sphingomonas bacterium]MDB5689293.1 hypothetical protein [Sphingomonas bacterium]